MSHLAPQAAIFSPSVARAAASTAKDWAYVDAWLKRQYARLPNPNPNPNSTHSHTTKPPSFERNTETLEALLALIAANEAADDERDRLASLEEAALDEVRAAEDEKNSRRQATSSKRDGGGGGDAAAIHGDLLAEDLLHAIDAGLSKEGLTALDAMADVAMALDMAADPSPAMLGHRFVELQGRAHEAEQLLHRVGMLQSYLDDEAARLSLFLEELKLGRQYELPPDVEKENAELERGVRAMSANLPELKRQVESLEKKVGIPPLTVEEVKKDEEAYLDLLVTKKDLDAQVKAFAGLPPDIEAARTELEGLRTQLREATERRDANFEMLVERESPVKIRTSRRP
ncbi:hypothetical protein HD806DRAFT_254093 [Xylariaceae sp. AK1471]|nr:hypothetical protein HD806DRAFT_254093 [Xylariaceae sp. AK1471]